MMKEKIHTVGISEWIKCSERLPENVGFYKVKTSKEPIGEVAYSKTFGGKFVWVIPDGIIITHWSYR